MDVGLFRPYVEATAMGLGVGMEREWSNRGGEQQSAGSRTFAALGLAGALAAELGGTVVAAGALGAGALLVAGYLRTARADRGSTTEAAALATYLLGALARHHDELAIGLAVTMAALLAAKGPIHRFAREVVTKPEVEDALRFFVIAFVVLPLLPDRSVGPYGALNPFRIWLLVVAFTGIGWVGYIAVRVLGARRGLLVTGIAGGFISATATTASLGRLARREPACETVALSGALLASGSTLVLLTLVTGVANAGLMSHVAPALGVGVAVLAAEVALLSRRTGAGGAATGEFATIGRNRPFALWPALVLAAVLTVVLLVARWGSDVLGSGGVVITTGVAGFADVHAPVLAAATLARSGSVSAHTALLATTVALATNTVSKCTLAFLVGGRRFGSRFTALAATPLGAIAAWLLIALR